MLYFIPNVRFSMYFALIFMSLGSMVSASGINFVSHLVMRVAPTNDAVAVWELATDINNRNIVAATLPSSNIGSTNGWTTPVIISGTNYAYMPVFQFFEFTVGTQDQITAVAAWIERASDDSTIINSAILDDVTTNDWTTIQVPTSGLAIISGAEIQIDSLGNVIATWGGFDSITDTFAVYYNIGTIDTSSTPPQLTWSKNLQI